jgi:Flp pilus assembly protein CpaB
MTSRKDVERWRALALTPDECNCELHPRVVEMADMIARLALALRDYADLYGATTDAALVLAEYDGRDSITMEARGRPWREWLGKEVNDGD